MVDGDRERGDRERGVPPRRAPPVRALRFGTLAWARRVGVLGHPRCPVELRASGVPGAGRGLFARRDLPAGAWVTPYAGVWLPSHAAAEAAVAERRITRGELMNYTLLAPDEDGGGMWVGRAAPHDGEGAAQLANDAVHRQVSGRDNNCEFAWPRGDARDGGRHGPLLRTLRPVRAGQELLVEYHVTYWLRRADHPPPLPRVLDGWLRCVAQLEAAVTHHGHELESYHHSEAAPGEAGLALHHVTLAVGAGGTQSSSDRAGSRPPPRVRRAVVAMRTGDSAADDPMSACVRIDFPASETCG